MEIPNASQMLSMAESSYDRIFLFFFSRMEMNTCGITATKVSQKISTGSLKPKCISASFTSEQIVITAPHMMEARPLS